MSFRTAEHVGVLAWSDEKINLSGSVCIYSMCVCVMSRHVQGALPSSFLPPNAHDDLSSLPPSNVPFPVVC